jgi:NitT/TauT family transport system substrate-binding protein
MHQVTDGFARLRSGPLVRLLAAVLVAAGLLAGHGAQAKEKVTVAALNSISSSPLFIAQEKGYYADEDLEVEFKFFRAAQPVAAAVDSGAADFGATAFTAGFYNLAGKGGLKVIGAQSREVKGYDGSAILVSNKAYEAGFTTVDDFPGHSLAMTQAGSSFHYMIGQVAEQAGFELSGVALKPLQSVPNMIDALRSGRIDSMIMVPHIAKALADSGAAKIVGWVADYSPYQVGGLFTSSRNVSQRRMVVERFVRAYQRAARDYHDALLIRDANGARVFGLEADLLIPLINKYVFPNKPSAGKIKAGAMYIDPEGRLDVGDVYRQVAWYKARDLVDESVDPKAIIDLSFIEGHFDVPR